MTLAVTCGTTRCHSLSLFVIRCTTRCHSLSLVATRCTTRLSFYKRSSFFATSPCSGHWLTCFARKGYSHKRLLFFPDSFTRGKNGRNSFSKEFSCSCAINKFRTGTFCRILNYSAEHLKIAGNYR